MAFSYKASDKKHLGGDVWLISGTFTNSDPSVDAGGDIVTGLSNVFFFGLQPTGTAVAADQCVVNETYDTDLGYYSTGSGTITIVTTLGVNGTWLAIGTF